MDYQLTFQYFSDLHLDYYNENLPKIERMFINKIKTQEQKPNILLLAGDIGKPTRPSYSFFLRSLSPFYDKIVIITGNHEYYNIHYHTLDELDHQCREICRAVPHNNIVFLQNDVYKLKDNLSIFGATFWTNIPENKYQDVAYYVNDYKYIPNFTPSLSSLYHEQSVSLLKYYLDEDEDMDWIVMSHHIPSFELIDEKYKKYNSSVNYAFASDISISNNDKIVKWVYGHTHCPKEYGKFYCNPIGYPGENKDWTLFKYFKI